MIIFLFSANSFFVPKFNKTCSGFLQNVAYLMRFLNGYGCSSFFRFAILIPGYIKSLHIDILITARRHLVRQSCLSPRSISTHNLSEWSCGCFVDWCRIITACFTFMFFNPYRNPAFKKKLLKCLIIHGHSKLILCFWNGREENTLKNTNFYPCDHQCEQSCRYVILCLYIQGSHQTVKSGKTWKNKVCHGTFVSPESQKIMELYF